ncbi:MAG TPA: sensor domain-containing diguanylate cyclase, partial [Steroidobacteraceae bacterium]|nr:sensor domain-containing diguanylate cyclase [Steroidobacteraceae bacterium]
MAAEARTDPPAAGAGTTERRFGLLGERSSDVLVELRDGTVTYISPNADGIGGLGAALVGRQALSIVHPDDRAALAPSFAPGWSGAIDAIFRVETTAGWAWREVRGAREQRPDGTHRAVLILRDARRREDIDHALRDSEELYRTIVAGMSEGVTVQAEDGTVIACNAAAERVLGIAACDLIGKTGADLGWSFVSEDGAPLPPETLPTTVVRRTGRACPPVTMGRRSGEGYLWLAVSAHPLGAVGPRAGAVVCTVADVTREVEARHALVARAAELARTNESLARSEGELARKSAELERALAVERRYARMDPLTGVLNYGSVTAEMQALWADGTGHFAALMADVDGLKSVNDTYGHHAGDAVLRRAASLLARDGAIVGRYGGDEFVVLLPGADRAAAESYVRGVQALLDASPVIDPATSATIAVRASMGIAAFPADAARIADLLHAADTAMYAEKSQRRRASRLSSLRELADDRVATTVGLVAPALLAQMPYPDRLHQAGHRIALHLGCDAVNIDVLDPRGEVCVSGIFVRAADTVIRSWNYEQA